MKTSSMLRNVKLIEIKDAKDSVSSEVVQSFVFTADANFNYQTQEGRALIESLLQEEAPEAENAEGSDQAQPEQK